MTIWAIEQFWQGRWVFRDWELTREVARLEMGLYRVLHEGERFRIRKYVRQEP